MFTGHASRARFAVAAAVTPAFNRLESDDVLVEFGRDDEIGAPAQILHRHLDLACAVDCVLNVRGHGRLSFR